MCPRARDGCAGRYSRSRSGHARREEAAHARLHALAPLARRLSGTRASDCRFGASGQGPRADADAVADAVAEAIAECT